MKSLKSILLLIVAVGFLTACNSMVKSNKYMTISVDEKAAKPSPGKALFVFMRANAHTGSFLNMSIWEASNIAKLNFIGILKPTMKASFEASPGKYLILVAIGGNSRIMPITVAADKTYYIVPGIGFSGLKIKPVKAGMKNPIKPGRMGTPSAPALAWAKKTDVRNSMVVKRRKAMIRWDRQTTKVKLEKTMVAADGR